MKKNDKSEKIVFISGNFNVIHPGHIRLFNFARTLGSSLVVGLYPDTCKNVYVSSSKRLAALQSLEMITYSYIMPGSLLDEIKKIRPDIVVKGMEHAKNKSVEDEFVDSYGGETIYSSGELWDSHLTESGHLRSNYKKIIHDTSYLIRRNINKSKLSAIVDKFQKLNVIVMGDLIIDQFINVEPIGMSREDATIVTTPIGSKLYLGGAGIVAKQVKASGCDTKFFSMTGSDHLRKFATSKLIESNISYSLYEDLNRPTTNKVRYQIDNKTLFRLSMLRHHPLDESVSNKIYSQVEKKLKSCDLLIFSDFSYGFLSLELVNKLIKLAKSLGVLVVADSQSSSQNGDLTKFIGADLATPTEYEARQSVSEYDVGLASIANNLISKLECKYLIITLGKDGLLIQNSVDKFATDQIEALNKNPVNVSGAGDVFLVLTSLALAVGASIWEAAYLGSVAAAVKVSRLENEPVLMSDILFELEK